MKTIKILSFAFAACALFSCSDDDSNSNNSNNNNNNGNAIAGTYNLTSVFAPEMVDFNMDETSSNELMNETQCYQGSQIILNDDNTFTSMLNYVIIGEQVECTTEEGLGTYTLSGNILVLTNNAVVPPTTVEYAIQDSGEITKVFSDYTYPTRDAEGNAVYAMGNTKFTYTPVD
jgi:hypothetical protein